MNTHIPISSNPNNWWQKARILYLNNLISKFSSTRNLNILEIGPGFGLNITTLSNYGKVDVVEVEKIFRQEIKNKYGKFIKDVYENIYSIDNKKYDLIVLLDVLEHIKDDELIKFIERVDNLLCKNGIVIISVPAYQSLFSQKDLDVGHYRRYSWKLLNEHIGKNFKIIYKFGFNYLLLIVRFFEIKLLKNPKKDLETSPLLNTLLYSVLLFEYVLYRLNIKTKFGISFFAVLKQTNSE